MSLLKSGARSPGRRGVGAGADVPEHGGAAAAGPCDGAALAGMVSEFVENALNRGGTVDIDARDMRTLVSCVTRLYAACSDTAGEEIPAIDTTVTTTEAVMLACALVRAHDLSPFDLTLWFSRVCVCPDEAEADDAPGAAPS